MPKHHISHWEVMGPDGAALAAFYGKVFEWSPEEYPGFNQYYGVSAEDAGTGGAVGKGGDDMPTYTALYVGVDSIDPVLETVKSAGGEVVIPRTVIPGVVAFALFRDPAGNVFGLSENETPAEG